jgi:1-acyl-sn-glycerol-3-phosphate acyltransferase
MIAARKGGPHGWVIDRYVRAKVRGAFRAIWRRGVLPSGPLLIYANHSNFWDGFVAHQLCEAARWDGYCLMEERNLRRYPFLRRIGAFSIRRGDAGSSLESLRYARRLLHSERGAVFVFPQGEHRPFGAGPIALERGIEVLARAAGARCLPLGIRYQFFEEELPHVLLEVGQVHPPVPLDGFRARLQEVVDSLAAVHSTEGFTPLLHGGSGVAERWDRVKALATGGRG